MLKDDASHNPLVWKFKVMYWLIQCNALQSLLITWEEFLRKEDNLSSLCLALCIIHSVITPFCSFSNFCLWWISEIFLFELIPEFVFSLGVGWMNVSIITFRVSWKVTILDFLLSPNLPYKMEGWSRFAFFLAHFMALEMWNSRMLQIFFASLPCFSLALYCVGPNLFVGPTVPGSLMIDHHWLFSVLDFFILTHIFLPSFNDFVLCPLQCFVAYFHDMCYKHFKP